MLFINFVGPEQEVDLMLNDGSKNVNAVEWRKNNHLTTRVEMSRRRTRRCLLMTLALAKTPEQQVSCGAKYLLRSFSSQQESFLVYVVIHYIKSLNGGVFFEGFSVALPKCYCSLSG